MKLESENALFKKVKNGNAGAFEELFNTFYQPMCSYAFQFLSDREEAEEVAQEIFARLWDKKSNIIIESSVKNYLFRSVRNYCLNIIQHNKVRQQYSFNMKENSGTEADEANIYLEPGLIYKIEKAIASMPEKRQEIFRLSREEGLKYKEIADKLNISVKTVEAQMGLALKYLRKKLRIYNPGNHQFQIFLMIL